MEKQEWGFKENHDLHAAASYAIRNIVKDIVGNIDQTTGKPVIYLGLGDPSVYPCFQPSPTVEAALVESIRSAKFNGYPPDAGIDSARRAIADYLMRDLPYRLTTDDVFLTCGANHGIEVLLTVLSRPGANILFPRPNYTVYEAQGRFSPLEVRHYDLLPEKGWEVDLESVEALADDKTVAVVLINPGNPCGNVFTYDQMRKIAETARQLGILVIADEVYAHQVFGENPFIPMGVFGDIAPVVTLGSLSKQWMIPGCRFGWIAITDPNGILQKTGLAASIKSAIDIAPHPATIVQGAIPSIIENTPESFFSNINKLLKEAADMFYERLKEIPFVECPHKPEGAMFAMVKLNLAAFDDIVDDTDFCMKMAKEESMTIFPGHAVGLKNWVRMTFSAESEILDEGIERLKAFCLRHAKH